MRIEFLCYGTLMSNCYAIVSQNEALVVDAGAAADDIVQALEDRSLTPKGILLTHGHFDHAWGARAVADRYGVPLYIHSDDGDMLRDGMKNAYSMCYGKDIDLGQADVLLVDGDEIELGGEKIKVLHTPGHSRGSVCYLAGKELISGDTLFSNSVGRWDLYGGSVNELRSSLLALSLLDESITIYPGHGGTSRLGDALDIALNLI